MHGKLMFSCPAPFVWSHSPLHLSNTWSVKLKLKAHTQNWVNNRNKLLCKGHNQLFKQKAVSWRGIVTYTPNISLAWNKKKKKKTIWKLNLSKTAKFIWRFSLQPLNSFKLMMAFFTYFIIWSCIFWDQKHCKGSHLIPRLLTIIKNKEKK